MSRLDLPHLSNKANKRLASGLWLGALLAFVLGTWIGLKVHAQIGFGLWITSAVLAFLPFLSARTRHGGKWAR